MNQQPENKRKVGQRGKAKHTTSDLNKRLENVEQYLISLAALYGIPAPNDNR